MFSKTQNKEYSLQTTNLMLNTSLKFGFGDNELHFDAAVEHGGRGGDAGVGGRRARGGGEVGVGGAGQGNGDEGQDGKDGF